MPIAQFKYISNIYNALSDKLMAEASTDGAVHANTTAMVGDWVIWRLGSLR